jgi:hypothetical protein
VVPAADQIPAKRLGPVYERNKRANQRRLFFRSFIDGGLKMKREPCGSRLIWNKFDYRFCISSGLTQFKLS